MGAVRYIKASPEVTRRVCAELGMSRPGLSRALNFKMNGKLARQARELALAYGAVEMGAMLEAETVYDALGDMVQTFSNGAVVRWSKESQVIRVERDGEEVAVFHGCDEAYLQSAQRLAISL